MDNVLTDKKLNEYRYVLDNMLAENELTVTITLHEYRTLATMQRHRHASMPQTRIGTPEKARSRNLK